MDISYLMPCICCLFWTVILFCRWRRDSLAAKVGAAALLLMGISSAIRFVLLTENYDTTDGWHIVETVCTLSFFSCIILYVQTLTTNRLPDRKALWVFLPALLIGGSLACLYLLMSREQRAVYIPEVLHPYHNKGQYATLFYQMYYMLYVYLYKITVVGMANVALAYTWSKYNKSLRPVLVFLTAAVLFSFFVLEWNYLIYKNYFIFIAICMCLWALALFFLGYQISRLKVSLAVGQHPSISESETWQRTREKLLPLFHQLMDEDHLFLQPNLRVDDLARQTQTNRNYIFLLLKEEYGCGFTEYINRRRIEYAQRLARLHPDLTQEQIAYKCGFTHSATFSRTFKQYTGTTFRQWSRKGSE